MAESEEAGALVMSEIGQIHDTLRRMNGRIQANQNNSKSRFAKAEGDIRMLKREVMIIALIAATGWLLLAI